MAQEPATIIEVTSMIDDYGVFDYIYEPPHELKQAVFTHLMTKITHGQILDLGCGKAGLYWSLGYIQRVEQVTFFDYQAEHVAFLHTALNELSAEQIEKDYGAVVSFLQAHQLLTPLCSYEALAEELVTKIVDIQPFDFLSDLTQERYDVVLCLQSIECVNTQDELDQALQTIRKILKPGGVCLGSVLRYQQSSHFTEKLIAAKLDGTLNPTVEQFQHALLKNGFQQINLQRLAITGQQYHELLLFTAENNDE
ncbi:MAG TPA: class I SAM-dependent methyltransferase, partial [Ktedonobacteraceae bacterium]